MRPEWLQPLRLSRFLDAAYPVVSLLVGSAVIGRLDDGRLALLVVTVICLNSLAMVWNDLEDRALDSSNGRPEVAQAGQAELRRLRAYVVALTVISLGLSVVVSPKALAVAIATIMVIWLYNSRPVQASRRPVLSIVILSGAGAFLPYLFGLTLGAVSAGLIALGLLWWLGRISLSVLKDYKDARGDALHDKRTFLLRYGARRVAVASVASLLTGYGSFIAVLASIGHGHWSIGLILVGIMLLAIMRRGLFKARATYRQLDVTFRRLAQYQMLLDASMVIWLYYS